MAGRFGMRPSRSRDGNSIHRMARRDIFEPPARSRATTNAMPPSHRRRHGPKPDRRRALELLAGSGDGYTEALMLAHGFTVELMVDLCIADLAIATVERMVAGGRTVEVVRLTITDAGRQALAEA